MEREYYSQRMGLTNTSKIDLFQLKKIFDRIHKIFFDKNYFMEKLGYYDSDLCDYCRGELGSDDDINSYLFLKLRKDKLWPISFRIKYYSEDDLFDIIEFCFDNISKPNYVGSFDNGKLVYDIATAQDEFRKMLNPHLNDYADGFSLNEKGFITLNPDYGLEQILEAKIISNDHRIKDLLEHAVEKFRNRNSSYEDRRESVRKLADILEYLRPSITKNMLTKDEKDLFNIANNFYLRHNTENQKADYDIIWLNWIFYLYLSTIHAITRIIKRHDEGNQNVN
jgi:hypothetical protein